MADFFSQMNEVLMDSVDNLRLTENGAVGYKSTGSKLTDMNFKTSSYRNLSDEAIMKDYADVCAEDLAAAIVWAFFGRDARGGMGERRLFRVCIRYLAEHYPDALRKVLKFVPEYGRWDDLFVLIDSQVRKDVRDILEERVMKDLEAAKKGESVSLLAKWLPSVNSHSPQTRKRALALAELLGIDRYQYQRMTSVLRKQIKTVESMMSANEWDKIPYEAVPSKANLIYKDAFLRHDKERRAEFLEALKSGETKINAGVLFPYEIVHKYGRCATHTDTALEEMWKALPDYVNGQGGTIVVADGSGSMMTPVGNGSVTCLDVANSLAIYFAERLGEPFHNKYITFSANPQLVNLGNGSLLSKLGIAYKHNECANTNIEKVFNLILDTAVSHKLTQDEMPKRILILSDGEFDSMTTTYVWHGFNYRSEEIRPNEAMFDTIKKRYEAKGYKLPKLVFWNICSRTNTIPVRENDLGVALVSGFSPSIAKMVFSNKLDPGEILSEQLHDQRYLPLWDVLLPN